MLSKKHTDIRVKPWQMIHKQSQALKFEWRLSRKPFWPVELKWYVLESEQLTAWTRRWWTSKNQALSIKRFMSRRITFGVTLMVEWSLHIITSRLIFVYDILEWKLALGLMLLSCMTHLTFKLCCFWIVASPFKETAWTFLRDTHDVCESFKRNLFLCILMPIGTTKTSNCVWKNGIQGKSRK